MSRKETPFDRIQNYYLKEASLTPKELEMCERYELAFSLFLHHRSRKETISKYISLQAQKGNVLSVATAYRDLETAERLFAPIQQYKKDFLRLTLIESAMKDLKRIEHRLAKDHLSSSDFSMLMNSKDRVEKRLFDLGGLGELDSNLPDFSALEPNTYEINVPKQMLSILSKMIAGGVTDLSGIDIEDVNYEELKSEFNERKS